MLCLRITQAAPVHGDNGRRAGISRPGFKSQVGGKESGCIWVGECHVLSLFTRHSSGEALLHGGDCDSLREHPGRRPALLHEGYSHITNRCRRLGSDVFETRLLAQATVCMQGPEAARAFYEHPITRVGARRLPCCRTRAASLCWPAVSQILAWAACRWAGVPLGEP